MAKQKDHGPMTEDQMDDLAEFLRIELQEIMTEVMRRDWCLGCAHNVMFDYVASAILQFGGRKQLMSCLNEVLIEAGELPARKKGK